MVKFGSIFRSRENCYVYLGQTENAIYAARILDCDQTSELQRLSERRARDGRGMDSTVFCFVILSTETFIDQAAHLHQTDNQTDLYIEEIGQLNNIDIEMLKTKILEDVVIPSGLKELIRLTVA